MLLVVWDISTVDDDWFLVLVPVHEGEVDESLVLGLSVKVEAFDLRGGLSGLVEESNVYGKQDTAKSLVNGLQLIDASEVSGLQSTPASKLIALELLISLSDI